MSTAATAQSSGGLFNSVGHFFASVAKAIVGAVKGAPAVVQQAEAGLSEGAQLAAGIVALLPAADQATVQNIENAAFALLGAVAPVVAKLAAAVSADGLNVVLDVGAVQAVQAALPAFGALLGKALPVGPAVAGQASAQSA